MAERMQREAYFNRIWYEGERSAWWLRWLAGIFRLLSAARRGLYRLGVLRAAGLPVPVIVIGNLTAGGTGKTPLTLWLVEELRARGFRPGIVSRGYGGQPGNEPVIVSERTPAARVGDEPLLLAHRSGVPVSVHPRRARAAGLLLASFPVDVIVCDDGLQHYALARDVEIAVVDGARGLGNGRMLPAGPLREPASRLRRVDHVVVNGELSAAARQALSSGGVASPVEMRLHAAALVNLRSGERREPAALTDRHCAALAGIGNPQRFFSTLGELGYSAECRAFPDHHAFTRADFEFAGERPLLMTEKDAVKAREFATADWWYLEIAAVIENAFVDGLAARVKELQETAT